MNIAFGIFRVGLFFFLMWIASTSDNVAFRVSVFVAWVLLEMAFLGSLQQTIRNIEAGRKRKCLKGKD